MNEVEDKKNKNDGENQKEYNIVVNGSNKIWNEKEITFDQVVILAFGNIDPNARYTMTYKRGHGNKPEGTMAPGDSVKVKEGMIFNVTPTNKS